MEAMQISGFSLQTLKLRKNNAQRKVKNNYQRLWYYFTNELPMLLHLIKCEKNFSHKQMSSSLE